MLLPLLLLLLPLLLPLLLLFTTRGNIADEAPTGSSVFTPGPTMPFGHGPLTGGIDGWHFPLCPASPPEQSSGWHMRVVSPELVCVQPSGHGGTITTGGNGGRNDDRL